MGLVMFKKSCLISLFFLSGIGVSANLFADESPINVTDGWVRETPPSVRNAAAFFTLNNTGNIARTITDIQCQTTIAARCEVHEHIHNNGVMRMQKVLSPLSIPANGKLLFAPGGYHVMLLELTKPLLAGTTVELVFVFDDQSTYKAQLPVKPVSQE
jgi:copper(I)-binding protein